MSWLTRRGPNADPETAGPPASRPPDPSFATGAPVNDEATPATVTASPADVGDHASPAGSASKGSPGTRTRDSLLWLWFVLTVGLMAVAGTMWGQFGALLAAIVLTVGIVLFAGYGIVPPRPLLAVFAVAVLAVAGLFAVRLQRPPTVAAPPTTAGHHLTAEFVRSAPRQGAVWPGINLDNEVIQDWDLSGLTAPGSSMRHTWLEGAHLAGADLRGADLWYAHLRGADLRAADLRGADLRSADLSDACLVGADLTGALLADAKATDAAVAAVTVNPAETRRAKWPRSAIATASGCP